MYRIPLNQRFIPNGSKRECPECEGVGGHYGFCDKTK